MIGSRIGRASWRRSTLLVATALTAVAAALSACRGGAVAIPPSGPNVVRIDDASGALALHETAIRETIDRTLTRVTAVLPVTGVTITVIPDASRAIPGRAAGGFTPSAASVELYLAPDFPRFAAVLNEQLAGLVAHELHHAMRWRGPGYGTTLLEALVSEGLADRFSVEVLGVQIPPWSDAIPRERTGEFLRIARTEFASSDYGHSRWFFGGDATLPRWAGYTLGFRLVEDYLARHPGATAASLVHTPADAFRPDFD